MSDQATVFFIITLLFLIMSLVFVLFFIFHNRKMIEHKTRLAEIELAKSKQDLKDSIEIQEKDMAKLGADLHDELGPTLSAVKLKINSISNGTPLQEHEIKQLRDMIDHTINNVRTLSHTLYPNTLKEFGLKDAIRELIKRISTITPVSFTTHVDEGSGRLDFNTQLSLYRIIQEFINNSLRHSGCTAISVRLTLTPQEVNLELTDNGRGFNSEQILKDGLGIKNMRMRAESIQATFQLESEKNKGAVLRVSRNLPT
jgi:signal transduction histidine kinase